VLKARQGFASGMEVEGDARILIVTKGLGISSSVLLMVEESDALFLGATNLQSEVQTCVLAMGVAVGVLLKVATNLPNPRLCFV
jgi:hypothetical protein